MISNVSNSYNFKANKKVLINQKENQNDKKGLKPYQKRNLAFFGFVGALTSCIAAPTITDSLVRSGDVKAHSLSINARVGMGIMLASLGVGALVNLFDKNGESKISKFTAKFYKTRN